MNTLDMWRAGLWFAVVGVGCATTAAPADLVAARAAYTQAQHGQAAQLSPADLHTAAEALASAERSFTDNGDTQDVRDLAYIAQRRAQIADARAKVAQSNQDEAKTVSAMHAYQANQVKVGAAQLGQANEKLAAQGQELSAEREGRIAADKRAAQAAADLAKFASVKQEARGIVITLSGSVLFASSKAQLLPGAQIKLDGVAQTLSQQDRNSKLVVEGHTDSQGAVAYNQTLSDQRAQVVREYLVSRGIVADRVTSRGFGAQRPIADNGSPEGRANNRRVEIVVEPSAPRAP